jgi:hypothetical protein
MEVLEFINTHNNWEDVLTQHPYYIKVKHDGNYILLKYNQLSSDFSLPIVRECRGSIFYLNECGKYECICRAFDKFGNYGELYVKDIDWNSAVVEEKIDGSLIKIWHHNDEWHISTNGTIDAFCAEIGDTELTFGDLVNEAIGCSLIPYFLEGLDHNTTYMFELVSPKSKVTISYPETKLYYLGQRDMCTMTESKNYTNHMKEYGILCPKIYPLNNIDSCLEYVKNMTRNEEGFVVRDVDFNRMKLKSPEYLTACHMRNNGMVTKKRIIEMCKNNTVDDFVAYCPDYREMVDEVLEDIITVCVQLDITWGLASIFSCLERKDFANCIKDFSNKEFLFIKYDNPEIGALEYLMNKPTSKIKDMIDNLYRCKEKENE